MSKPTPRVSDGHTRNIYYMYSGRLFTKYRQQNRLTDLHVHPESQTPSSVLRTGVMYMRTVIIISGASKLCLQFI